MEAIILAGGRGTRLKSVVADIPKPMVPIAGKPFLVYLLDYLRSYCIDRVILSVCYNHKTIIDFFARDHAGIDLSYSIEERPLGTGGAIAAALDHCRDDNVFVLNGDSFFPIILECMVREHISSQAPMSIALKRVESTGRYGRVAVENGYVSKFMEKSQDGPGLINGGVYLVQKSITDYFPSRETFSFEKDFMENTTTIKMKAHISSAYFIDIGVPDDLARAEIELPGMAR